MYIPFEDIVWLWREVFTKVPLHERFNFEAIWQTLDSNKKLKILSANDNQILQECNDEQKFWLYGLDSNEPELTDFIETFLPVQARLKQIELENKYCLQKKTFHLLEIEQNPLQKEALTCAINEIDKKRDVLNEKLKSLES